MSKYVFPLLMLNFVLVISLVFLTKIVKIFIHRVLLMVEHGELSHRVQGHRGTVTVT